MKIGLLAKLITNCPNLPDYLGGHAVKCIVLSLNFYIGCLIAFLMLRLVVYRFIGELFGLRLLYLMDVFYLYDLPSNPIMLPVQATFEKKDGLSDKQFIDTMFDRIEKSNEYLHCMVKFRKIMGMYFFQELNKEERQAWKYSNMFIVPDIKTKQNVFDFFARIRKLPMYRPADGVSNTHIFYYPNYEDRPGEACFTVLGHHTT
jgi:hypothetical protein